MSQEAQGIITGILALSESQAKTPARPMAFESQGRKFWADGGFQGQVDLLSVRSFGHGYPVG